ncbi:UPF0303 protein RHE_CH02903 [Arthrobacter sp. Hiyo6]|nr:UPF0303 protein RHE_CH02903 [Arthrobacter sp. Hiyo6]
MVTEPAVPSTESENEFDPDSPDTQTASALRSLIERIETEVSTLQLSRFNQADALALGLLLVDMATERNLPIAIDIRRNKHVLFHVSLPGATPDNEIWVEKKSRTAQRYAEPSLLVGLKGRLDGGSLEDKGWFDQARYAPHGGAFPIYVKGTGHVATVTVSGLPQKADHNLVVEALTSFSLNMREDTWS